MMKIIYTFITSIFFFICLILIVLSHFLVSLRYGLIVGFQQDTFHNSIFVFFVCVTARM
jgi:hypothetical protein